jgi:hypothetical protein
MMGRNGNQPVSLLRRTVSIFLLACLVSVTECGAQSPGQWQPLVPNRPGESHWLVKDMFLTAGSAYTQKTSFDHAMNEAVNLFFVPRDERNHYVAHSRWIDPLGREYRTIRTTYDIQEERKSGEDREKKGTTRIHTMSTRELVNHKPGMWKVELYLNDELVRTLTFTVR